MNKFLPDVANITTGNLDANEAVPGGKYPFFTCAPEPSEIDSFSFDEDAILLAGNNAQGNFHISRYNGKFNAYQRTYVITAKEGYDVDYICYSIELALNYLKKIAQGSQTKFLTKQILNSFVIVDKSLLAQENTVKILKAIDLKLSNNSKIISALESMAKTLYDYWFVQFDFPDANGRPYKTSGGKMVWNEELGREIPEGWEVKTIREICETRLGGTPDTNNADYWGGEIPWLNSGEVAVSPILESEKAITELGRDNSATSIAAPGDVLMSITRYIRPSILGITACYNQSVVAIIQNSSYKTSFIYPFLLSQVDRYMGLRIGAQQPHINKKIVDSTPVIDPTKEILEAYYLKIDKTYQQIINIAKETKTLISLRDFLLPMLMNGQVGFK